MRRREESLEEGLKAPCVSRRQKQRRRVSSASPRQLEEEPQPRPSRGRDGMGAQRPSRRVRLATGAVGIGSRSVPPLPPPLTSPFSPCFFSFPFPLFSIPTSLPLFSTSHLSPLYYCRGPALLNYQVDTATVHNVQTTFARRRSGVVLG